MMKLRFWLIAPAMCLALFADTNKAPVAPHQKAPDLTEDEASIQPEGRTETSANLPAQAIIALLNEKSASGAAQLIDRKNGPKEISSVEVLFTIRDVINKNSEAKISHVTWVIKRTGWQPPSKTWTKDQIEKFKSLRDLMNAVVEAEGWGYLIKDGEIRVAQFM